MSSITDRVLKTLKPTGKDYRIRDKAGVGSGYHGFGVKVSARGKRTFFLEYTLGGKRRFLNLGHYPAKKLKGAREEAKQARTLINQGVDPQLERARIEAEQEEERKRIEAENRATTVNEVLDFYLGTLRETTGKEVERLLINRYCNVRKRIGDRKMKDIVEDDVEDRDGLIHLMTYQNQRIAQGLPETVLYQLMRLKPHGVSSRPVTYYLSQFSRWSPSEVTPNFRTAT